MLKKILVAFDDSKGAHKAFDFGCELARAFGAELFVLAVIQIPEPTTSVELGGILDSQREHFEKAFEALRAKAAGVKLSTEVDVGHPAEHILAHADKLEADLIVMGRRGRTTISRWLLGSVSERVLRYAHCPVTVTK